VGEDEKNPIAKITFPDSTLYNFQALVVYMEEQIE
jgi:hypothetical protein